MGVVFYNWTSVSKMYGRVNIFGVENTDFLCLFNSKNFKKGVKK